ncbi:MAG TPA: sulfate reduction electron transfer complex DsrMKJOP subunit DsrM [Desulfitobacterium dehalogenans]|uniref:Sulfate reduction electron transfer complex DsrMKJOP subunit DsrM n=1 Tax=Desulfitobacterium dehalogenans TaxID=36854 RepID=A0A7C7D6Y5_9FIRM|nr:sulfate reduction electron transfer complex DsrMKJOP subunit DsrM [Desulfitobacterium dehalogenans]
MKALFSLIAVLILMLIPLAGVGLANLQGLFGIILPYAALILFLGGFIYRVIGWARTPVPFRIPTTVGQGKSFDWIKQNKIENPTSNIGVIIRMAMEVFLFRSLFRNSKTELRNGENGPQLAHGSNKWLWLFGLMFHWSLLIILIRHLRLFLEPVPAVISSLDSLDSFFQIGLPALYITDILIVAALTFLFLRRVVVPQVKTISLAADYFPLFLLMGIAATGMLMRYIFRVDIAGIKEFAVGLLTFTPHIPEGIGTIFYVHLFFVSCLFAYFPLSKLMHMGGIFMNPTRNMKSNNRMERHINPWNYPVEVHTYEEYEDDFRTKMMKAGIPVEKE